MKFNKRAIGALSSIVFCVNVAAYAQTGTTPQPKNEASDAPKPPTTPDGNGQTPPPSDPATYLRDDLNHDGVPESQLQIQKSEAVGPQSEGSADEKLSEPWPWAQNTMLGDLFGARSGLQNAGITFQGSATLDFVNALAGAPVNGFSMVSLIDVNLSGDTE
jgi:hypothetical protein